MRYTTRLLAAAKTARFLEANTPTGLTGLFTHPSPRSTLIYLYTASLEKLSAFPADSVYRKSTEALTKHRLEIISSVKPEGLEAFNAEAKAFIEKHPGVLNTAASGLSDDGHRHVKQTVGGQTFIHTTQEEEYDVDKDEWDNETEEEAVLEGSRSTADRASQAKMGDGKPIDVNWEAVKEAFSGQEPPLTADQISDVENRIGAGLIEEVIQVAEGELKLIDTMAQAKVWEDLEEKPVEGQWSYFMRDTATPATQTPPQK